MPTLILIRGLPGSGKSSLANHIYYDYLAHGSEENQKVFVEADSFFIHPFTLKYIFDPLKLGDAHASCLAKTRLALQQESDVVVSNTFTTRAELEPYFELARTIPNVEVQLIEVQGPWKSEHDVPERTIERMANRWERVDLKTIKGVNGNV